ncbi:MAG: ribonuclease P protein component [Alphaproteobacteria bacterium]|nr:ribonuclease P protein component [Alphaproteobacteria bacterium]
MHATAHQLAQLQTLKKRADFIKVQKTGRRWVSNGLILQAAANASGYKGIGFTVSKRVDKSAVRRNRIKRRLRAVAADILPQTAVSGTDYVLIGRPETLSRPYADLLRDLRWCLKKMDLLDNV